MFTHIGENLRHLFIRDLTDQAQQLVTFGAHAFTIAHGQGVMRAPRSMNHLVIGRIRSEGQVVSLSLMAVQGWRKIVGGGSGGVGTVGG